MAAWAWELNAKLTGPTSIRASTLYNDDVLKVLLLRKRSTGFSSRAHARSSLGMMRRTLQAEYKAGRLPFHAQQTGGGRGQRSWGGWLRAPVFVARAADYVASRRALPAPLVSSAAYVLAGSMHPASVSLWVAVTSYIFIGIEEVGVQVSSSRSCR